MPDSTVTQHLGKYIIHEELGRGGFGTVYRATDTTLDRVVALKILDPLLTRDPSFLERFHREARGAARLEHPNIVPVYEVGEAEGRSFIAMKYLPGRSLDKLLVEGRLPVERTLHILAQVATALDFAHSKGLIHRDVKPSNILVGPDELTGDPDHATLTDFGLARASDQSIMTSLGQALGTPAYMAPEQLDVDRQTEVGPSSDIYSFAIVAYEMLAGRPPFVGPTPAVMAAHLTKEPPQVTQFNADLPPMLWEALVPGLAKQIAARPKTAGALVAALQKGLAQAEKLPIMVKTAPPEAGESPTRVVEAHDADAGMIATAAIRPSSGAAHEPVIGTAPSSPVRRWLIWLVLGCVAVILLALALRAAGVIPGRSSPTPVVVEKVVKETIVVEKTVEKIVRITEAPPTPTVTAPPTSTPRPTSTPMPDYTRMPMPTNTPSPTETRVPSVSPIIQRITLVGEPRIIRAHQNRVTSVAFSPNGQLLASGSDDQTIKLWRISDGTLKDTLAGHTGYVYEVAFSPDDSLLASVSQDKTVRLWSVIDGTSVGILSDYESGVGAVSFSPDGQILASGSDDGLVRLRRVSDGAVIWETKEHVSKVQSVAFSADGEMLASGSDDGSVRLWRASDGAPLNTLLGHTSVVWAVTFAPTSGHGQLASGGWDDSVRLWRTNDGAYIKTLRALGGAGSVAFHPLGEFIVGAGGLGDAPKIWIWRISDGALVQELDVKGAQVMRQVSFSPDGSLLASASHDGIVRLWQVQQ